MDLVQAAGIIFIGHHDQCSHDGPKNIFLCCTVLRSQYSLLFFRSLLLYSFWNSALQLILTSLFTSCRQCYNYYVKCPLLCIWLLHWPINTIMNSISLLTVNYTSYISNFAFLSITPDQSALSIGLYKMVIMLYYLCCSSVKHLFFGMSYASSAISFALSANLEIVLHALKSKREYILRKAVDLVASPREHCPPF